MEQINVDSTRRIRFFYVLMIFIFAVFIGRLFDLQVLKHEQYKLQATEEHQRKFEIAPSRGEIYIRDGEDTVPLVLNENRPTLFADPTGIDQPEAVAEALKQIIGGKLDDITNKLKTEDTAYVVLKREINAEQVKKIKTADLPGIGMQDATYRVYPEAGLGSQIIGFVNGDGDGQYGIEESLNEQLSGTAGSLRAVTDVNGIPLSTDEDAVEVPAVNGQAVTLTIDRSIQKKTEDALRKGVKASEGERGSAIVYNPNTGEILAMANYPSYNPIKFEDVSDYSRFQNDVVSRQYETGSGMKVFTMSTGLNEDVVQRNSTYYDAGFVRVDDRTIENAGTGGGVTRTMLEVIQRSVNTGVLHVLAQLGGGEINDKARNTLYEYFTERFGFGTLTGIAQPSEAAGSLIAPNEQEGNNVRYANMAFGQGMTVTMLQMVSALAAVINGGIYYQPHLVHSQGETQNDPKALRTNVVSQETTADMLAMTQAVVNSGGGLVAKRDGFMIGGKTGTAQYLDPNTGEYSDFEEIGSFMGYGGGDRPEYVIMTRVDRPKIFGYAGTVAAAPIFAEISNFMIDYWRINPNQ